MPDRPSAPDLASRRCQPCEAGATPLAPDAVAALVAALPAWRLSGEVGGGGAVGHRWSPRVPEW